MSVLAVPRSTPIAFAGNRLPALKKGQRIYPWLRRSLRCRERAAHVIAPKTPNTTPGPHHGQGIGAKRDRATQTAASGMAAAFCETGASSGQELRRLVELHAER